MKRFLVGLAVIVTIGIVIVAVAISASSTMNQPPTSSLGVSVITTPSRAVTPTTTPSMTRLNPTTTKSTKPTTTTQPAPTTTVVPPQPVTVVVPAPTTTVAPQTVTQYQAPAPAPTSVQPAPTLVPACADMQGLAAALEYKDGNVSAGGTLITAGGGSGSAGIYHATLTGGYGNVAVLTFSHANIPLPRPGVSVQVALSDGTVRATEFNSDFLRANCAWQIGPINSVNDPVNPAEVPDITGVYVSSS